MDRQTAQRIQDLVRRLEAFGEDKLGPNELNTLRNARARLAEAEQTTGEFTSRYRGALQGVTLRGADELAGLAAGAVPGGMTQEQALEQARQRNLEAQLADPEGYSTGEMAGMGLTGAASMAVPSVAARNVALLPRMLLGGAEGVALATAPEFLGGEGGFVPRVQQVQPMTAAAGGLLGMTAPAAGEIVGGVVRGVQNLGRGAEGFGARAIQTAARGVGRTDAAGEDIEAYMRSLGDEAMLADVPGGQRSQAMGLAAMQGEGGTVVGRALAERAASAEARIGDVFDRLVAQPNAAFQQRVALATQRSGTLGPAYDAALRSNQPLNVMPIADQIDAVLEDATGQVAQSLTNVRNQLSLELPDPRRIAEINEQLRTATGQTARRLEVERAGLESRTGEVSAARLHNVRTDLSYTISEATRQGRGGQVAALKPILQRIDDELDQIEGYAATRGSYADNRAMERAIEDGRRAFVGGATSVETPDQLAARWAKMTDAEKDAFRLGAREYVAALMGTARNAPATAWGTMTTGFNDRKMQIVFGSSEADEISRLLRGERAFSETRGQVTQGSMTAMREAAREDIADLREPNTGRRAGPIGRIRDTINEAGNAAIDSILYGPSRSRANQELGRILSMQGAERDRMLNVLLLEAQRQQDNTRAQAIARLITEAVTGGLITNIGGSE